jgi:hypothetical protein
MINFRIGNIKAASLSGMEMRTVGKVILPCVFDVIHGKQLECLIRFVKLRQILSSPSFDDAALNSLRQACCHECYQHSNA